VKIAIAIALACSAATLLLQIDSWRQTRRAYRMALAQSRRIGAELAEIEAARKGGAQ